MRTRQKFRREGREKTKNPGATDYSTRRGDTIPLVVLSSDVNRSDAPAARLTLILSSACNTHVHCADHVGHQVLADAPMIARRGAKNATSNAGDDAGGRGYES